VKKDRLVLANREQLKSYVSDLRVSFIAGTVLLGLIGLAAIIFAPSYNTLVTAFVLPFILVLIISSVSGLIVGRAFYWFLFLISCFLLLGGIFAMALMPFLGLTNPSLIGALYLLLATSSFFSWRWGAGIYNPGTMKEVLASKRIDIERGTYSPFTFPFGILKTKGSKKWFVIANTSGPLFIAVAVVIAGVLGRRAPGIGDLWVGICGYVSIVLLIGCIRASLGEYSWIRRWEKETGRKMYISYVVDWKRYKREEKARREAEVTKLKSSRN